MANSTWSLPVVSPKIILVKQFYTGPSESAELLVVMLEKYGIQAAQEFAEEADPDDPDGLNRHVNVLVPVADYPRAFQLFYADKENEI